MKFIRRIQEQNRVAIPQEILNDVKWDIGEYVYIELKHNRIIINKRD